MPDLSQIDEALRGILVADGTLTADLSSATAVYQGRTINTVTSFPLIRFFTLDDQPNLAISGYGDFDLRMEFAFMGVDPTVLKRLIARADQLLVIPYNRATEITTDNYRVRRMYRRNMLGPIGTGKMVNSLEVQSIVTEWDLKVTRHTA